LKGQNIVYNEDHSFRIACHGKENPGVPRILYTQSAVSFWLDAEGLAIAA
jgi:hypothetical protein